MHRNRVCHIAAVLLATAWTAFAAEKPAFQALEFKASSGKTLRYRLLEPPSGKAGRKAPLVIFLHGVGERGSDNRRQLANGVREFFLKADHREKFPCFALVPQCPRDDFWVKTRWNAESMTQAPKPTGATSAVLELAARLIRERPVDADRVYVMGLSMGGYGTWDLITRKPKLFAAAVPICGGGDESKALRAKGVAVWAFHGERDGVVKPHRSKKMVAAIRSAGGKAKLTTYPGVGHGAWGPALREPALMAWMFAQKRPAPKKAAGSK